MPDVKPRGLALKVLKWGSPSPQAVTRKGRETVYSIRQGCLQKSTVRRVALRASLDDAQRPGSLVIAVLAANAKSSGRVALDLPPSFARSPRTRGHLG